MLTVKNLEERLSLSAQEIVSLKQRADEANAKAQSLAIKAIERPTTIVAPSNAAPMAQHPYNERSQVRNTG